MLQLIVWPIIVLLFVTGGFRGKIELSQIDIFGWIALLLGLVQWKMTGHFLPPRYEKIGGKLATITSNKPSHFLMGLCACHVIVFTWLQVWRYHSFQINAFDIGYIDQAVWSVAYLDEGTFLHSNLSRGVQSYLSEHFSPILAVFGPLYKIWPTIYWLFLIQSMLLASGAVLIYKLARYFKQPGNLALFFSFAFLIYQPLRGANHFDFREDCFYVPVFLGMILCLEKRKWLSFWSLALIAFTIKENAPLPLFAIGVWALIRKHFAHGTLLCVISALGFYIINSLVMPQFSAGAANTVISGRLVALESLARFISTKFNKGSILYILTVFLPFVPFLFSKPLKYSFTFVIALGLFLMNLIITEHKIGFHYECILIPFLFSGLVYSFSTHSMEIKPRNAVPLLLTLLFCVYGRSPILGIREYKPTADQICLRELLKHLPSTASLETQSGLYPHLDHRKSAFLFSGAATAKSELVVLSRTINSYGLPNFSKEFEKMFSGSLKYEQRIVHHPLVTIWCRQDVCSKYAELKQKLNSLSCLHSAKNFIGSDYASLQVMGHLALKGPFP